MKIQVDCVKGRQGVEPRYLWLGTRRLHVVQVLERAGGEAQQTYRLRIEDRREFTLRYDPASGEWQLVQVCASSRDR
jgi:hypothetical protein